MRTRIKYYFLFFLVAAGRKLYRVARYHYIGCENKLLAEKFIGQNEKNQLPFPQDALKAYHERWKPLGKKVSDVYLKNTFRYSGRIDMDIVPSDIYFSVIEPSLNNRSYAKSYEDKARIDWINGTKHVPTIFVRNINGVYYHSNQEVIAKDQINLAKLLKGEKSVIVKKSIEAHGGSGITVFDRRDDGHFYSDTEDVLSLDFLERIYKQDFLVQKYVDQHAFYKKFNPTSLNTLRVLTYRSVKDNEIHVVYSYLRIGGIGSRVDNVKQGGIAVCLKPDGYLVDFGLGDSPEKVYSVDGLPPFSMMDRFYKIDEIWETAKEIAAKQLYCRLVGFDMAVDASGKILHIETNTSDIGMEGDQYVIGPLFHRFTSEIIEYCTEKVREVPLYKLHDS